MLINTPEVTRTLNDYDVLFSNGYMMPITIDQTKGDTINFDDKVILVHLSSKPSQMQPEKVLPAEDITIFTTYVLSIQHRAREVTELSPEAQLTAKKVWQDLITSNTVQ